MQKLPYIDAFSFDPRVTTQFGIVRNPRHELNTNVGIGSSHKPLGRPTFQRKTGYGIIEGGRVFNHHMMRFHSRAGQMLRLCMHRAKMRE